jgi:hypothetical protein
MIFVKAKVRALNNLITKRVPKPVSLTGIRIISEISLETLGIELAWTLLFVFENIRNGTKDSVMIYSGFLLEVFFVKGNSSKLHIDGLVQQDMVFRIASTQSFVGKPLA